MKKTILFSKFFIPAAIIATVLIIFGVLGFIFHNGFALGVDFQAGLIQEVQVTPTAFSVRWTGVESATLYHDRNTISIVTSGFGVEGRTYTFSFNEYNTIGSLTNAMKQQLGNLDITVSANQGISSSWLRFSSIGNTPELSRYNSYIIHYLDPQRAAIDISEVRSAMAGFSHGVAVQNIVTPDGEARFMIRVEDQEEGRITSNDIVQTLESHFSAQYGGGCIAVFRSEYVGSRFSKDLTDQAGILITLTLLLVLIYSTIRFRLQYAVGAVIAIMYDVLIIVAFMVWTRMEFTTLSIAAILTILGYSTNNTIIFFDRVRENLRLFPDHQFTDILNISLTGILGRTIITTATTMLAVLALFIFTTGSMKDFALALLVGMTSGVFTTLFIVSGFVNFWQNLKIKREKKKLAAK